MALDGGWLLKLVVVVLAGGWNNQLHKWGQHGYSRGGVGGAASGWWCG